MNADQIKYMVDRFLMWPLPRNFTPDNGISYKRPNYAPNVPGPSGTNLLDATQADAMVRHMGDGLPAVNSHATLTAALEEARGALVEEIGKRICHWQQGGLLCTYPNCDCGNWKWRAASEILALILSRLGDVTPEMVEAVAKAMAADEGWGWDNPETLRDWWINQARVAISAFLAASPLAARMDSP